MAGIYIHIPFCKTRCIYCDFYSNIKMDQKERFLPALFREIDERFNYLDEEPIHTLYFGGGTPSQLEESDFKQIFEKLNEKFDLSTCQEITIEANPDDLTAEYISMLRQFPFNRISIGIQSFNNDDLKFLNRRHHAQRAIQAIKDCQAAGFDNLSIDLMYGLPNQSIEQWQQNITTAVSLGVQHISSYHLIYEEGTKLHKLLQIGDVKESNEELSLEMFSRLIYTLKEAGFMHYEVSNFAQHGYISQHNSSYWLGKSYLGLGPSAHSFNQSSRCYNSADLNCYIAGPTAPKVEQLSVAERYNDLILTSLRTHWGLSLEQLEATFGKRFLNYCLFQAEPHIERGNLIKTENRLKLSPEGIFVSDGIMSDLMYID